MKKVTAASLLILLFIAAFAQERIAKGYVLDEHSRAPIEGALVNVYDTNIINFTDRAGVFNILMPKKRRHLLISHENYLTKKIILGPGFQHKKTTILLESINSEAIILKEKQASDSLFLSYKNTLSLSIMELFIVAIAGRYERFLTPRHSLGLHASVYVYGRNPVSLGSEHDYYPVYHGFKLAPAYRFYPWRKNGRGLFVEAKLPIGYIHFSELDYHSHSYGSHLRVEKEYSLWTFGYNVGAGLSVNLKKPKHAILSFSFGYQYFPLDVPEKVTKDLGNGVIITLPTDTYWWYEGGPGSKFEFKFMIGGIF